MKKGYLLGWTVILLFLFTSKDLKGQSFVTNGSASFLGGSCYQLTPDVGGQSGSIFSNMAIDLTQPFAFDAVFYFGNKDANGADGIVFILATSNTALGVGGGGIGYEGITPSIAIEYDDYFNGGFGDPTADHIAVISGGSVNHGLPTNLAGPISIANIEDGEEHCFSVIWDPVTFTLTAALDGDLISYTGNIVANIFSGNPLVYYGFSSGTGSLSNLHRVCFGPPLLVPMPDVTICQGEDVQLQADENGVLWSWAPNPTLSQFNISDPIADPIVTTTYTVGIEYACGGFNRDTVVVTVRPLPAATADNTGPVCPGESIMLSASGGTMYHWNGPMGYNSFIQNPVINNMTPGKTGTYTVTVTDAAGCTNTATTNVTLFSLPFVEIDPVDGPLCEDGDAIQLQGLPSGGVWSGNIDPNGVFDPQQNGEGLHVITYTITDGNGCTNSDQITIKVVPNVPAEIMPEGPFCLSEQVVTLTANPPGGTWGETADSDGQIYPSSLFPGLFLVTYELTGQDECYNTTFYVEIVTQEVVMCPGVPPVCVNSPPVQLTASPPGGTWSGAADANGLADPMALGPGTHQAFYSYQSGTCPPVSCWSYVIVQDAPTAQNLIVNCDPTGAFYTVSFNINGGDAPTYSVTGTVNGIITPGTPATFVSNMIPSGNSYQFQIFDGNHCDTMTVSGSYSCNCPTQAGTMDMNPITVCEGDTIRVLPPTGVVLDPNDTLVYVLHTGDPHNFLLMGNGNAFVFGPPLQTGVPYFISVLAGNTIPGVGVDLTDPCLSIAHGPTVIWHALPSGFLSGPTMICAGDSVALSFMLTGIGPFFVRYTDGSGILVLDSIQSGQSIIIHPDTTTTYTLIGVTDKSGPGCEQDVDTSITISLSTAIHAQHVLHICEGDSLFLAGAFQSDPGVYYDTIIATVGCDTVIESYLLLNAPDTTYISGTTCDINQVGVFETVVTNYLGCDSTIINTVSLISADTTLLASATCDPAAAGVFQTMLTGQSGCDSLVIETITLLPSDTVHLASGNCDVAATGTFMQTLTNSFGCDSIVIETVSLLPSDTTLLMNASCVPADTGIISTVWQNTYGCDSLVIQTTQLISSWFTSDTTSTCIPGEAGVFTSMLISSQGCDSLVEHVVELFPSNIISTFITTCEPLDTGVVFQLLTNIYGCDSLIQFITQLAPADSCLVIAHEIFVPNVFSPNDDGINDLFFISGDPVSVEKISYLRIYDRWGSLVYDHKDLLPNDVSQSWDGTMLHRHLNPGVFVWVAEVIFTDEVVLSFYGDVTLVR